MGREDAAILIYLCRAHPALFFTGILILPSLGSVMGFKPLCTGHLKDGSENECPSRHPPFLGPLHSPIFLHIPKLVDCPTENRREWSKKKTGGRRERERIALPCPQPFVHRHLKPVTGPREGHFRMRRFFVSSSSFIRDCRIEVSLSVRRLWTQSTSASD